MNGRSIHTSSLQRGSDPYSILGVPRSASSADIKKRYRELAKQYHPDINPGPEACAKMAAISSAYQALLDPKQEDVYDGTGVNPDQAGRKLGKIASPLRDFFIYMNTDYQ